MIPALYRAHGDPPDARDARRLATDLLSSWDIATWRLGLKPADLEHHRSFVALVADLYGTWARREGKPRWGDKTPLYVLEIDTLLKLFPRARVINIVRDGRDVALSMMRQPWGPTNAYTAGLLWRRAVAAGQDAARRLPGETFAEVRYERLLSDPETELRRVCRFLGERFDPALLTASRLPPPDGCPNPWPAALDEHVDVTNAGRWLSEMSRDDRAVFESVAGEQLQRAGYPLSIQPRRIRANERARWRLHHAAGFVRWRLTTWDRGPRARTTLILTRAWVKEHTRARNGQRHREPTDR